MNWRSWQPTNRDAKAHLVECRKARISLHAFFFIHNFSEEKLKGGALVMGVMVPDVAENVKLCIFPTCPTYKASGLSGILYCAKGKAKENVKQKGCLCPTCPVAAKYNLEDTYYCELGKSAEL